MILMDKNDHLQMTDEIVQEVYTFQAGTINDVYDIECISLSTLWEILGKYIQPVTPQSEIAQLNQEIEELKGKLQAIKEQL